MPSFLGGAPSLVCFGENDLLLDPTSCLVAIQNIIYILVSDDVTSGFRLLPFTRVNIERLLDDIEIGVFPDREVDNFEFIKVNLNSFKFWVQLRIKPYETLPDDVVGSERQMCDEQKTERGTEEEDESNPGGECSRHNSQHHVQIWFWHPTRACHGKDWWWFNFVKL